MAPSSSPWRCVVLAILAWVSCPAFPAFAPRTRTQRQVLNRPWIPWQGTLSSPHDRGVNVAPQRDAWEEFMAAMVGAPDGPSLLSQSAANMHCMHQNMFWWVIHVWHAVLHNQSQGPKRRSYMLTSTMIKTSHSSSSSSPVFTILFLLHRLGPFTWTHL